MPNEDQETPNTADAALELNKETLQDLDLEPADPENVKGGGAVTSVGYNKLPAVQMTLTCAVPPTTLCQTR